MDNRTPIRFRFRSAYLVNTPASDLASVMGCLGFGPMFPNQGSAEHRWESREKS